jgi:hypothetical protein
MNCSSYLPANNGDELKSVKSTNKVKGNPKLHLTNALTYST